MIIDKQRVGFILVLKLSGEFILGDAIDSFKCELEKNFFQGQCNILLNMENINRIDSSAIGCLITSMRLAKECGGDLKIISPSKNVCKALETMRLEEFFGMFKDEQEALEGFTRLLATKEVGYEN